MQDINDIIKELATRWLALESAAEDIGADDISGPWPRLDDLATDVMDTIEGGNHPTEDCEQICVLAQSMPPSVALDIEKWAHDAGEALQGLLDDRAWAQTAHSLRVGRV